MTQKRGGARGRSSYSDKGPHRYSDLYAQWAQACLGNAGLAAQLGRVHSDRCLGHPHERLSPSRARELHYLNMSAGGRRRPGAHAAEPRSFGEYFRW